MSETISAAEARRTLYPLIAQVNAAHAPVRVHHKDGNAVMMAVSDYEALQTSLYLRSTAANSRRLDESLAQLRVGEVSQHDLLDTEWCGWHSLLTAGRTTSPGRRPTARC
ncbi:type II toxin-antitoxin system Phd/YefM family antitoxin [Isoptericola halotolerans]|uniref:type II toxin-antitoxin system Phd/YefM family antitoxin n=1 Tax=Isoptericola halotolerans TaxID=300560 RepID=UPI00388EB391